MKNILGIDPGKDNYAWTIISPKGRVINSGFLQNRITTLARGDYECVENCYLELKELVKRSGASRVYFEQFAARQFGTSLSQFVNMMNGLLTAICIEQGVEHIGIMPSSWKNAINKVGTLDRLYAMAAQQNVAPHSVDSICIGIYGMGGFGFSESDRQLISAAVARVSKLGVIAPMKPKKKRRRKRK